MGGSWGGGIVCAWRIVPIWVCGSWAWAFGFNQLWMEPLMSCSCTIRCLWLVVRILLWWATVTCVGTTQTGTKIGGESHLRVLKVSRICHFENHRFWYPFGCLRTVPRTCDFEPLRFWYPCVCCWMRCRGSTATGSTLLDRCQKSSHGATWGEISCWSWTLRARNPAPRCTLSCRSERWGSRSYFKNPLRGLQTLQSSSEAFSLLLAEGFLKFLP